MEFKTYSTQGLIDSLICDLTEVDLKEKVISALGLALSKKPVKSLNKPELAWALRLLGSFVTKKFLDEEDHTIERTSESKLSEENPTIILPSQYSQIGEEGEKKKVVTSSPKPQSHDDVPICHFYKRKRCKFMGKDKSKCKFAHPPKCQVFMKNGPWTNKNQKGCKVKKCTFFHPKLCPKSLQERKCKALKCPFSHLQGTRERPKIQGDSSSVGKKSSPVEKIDQSSFLEALKTVTMELRNVTTRLASLQAGTLAPTVPSHWGGTQLQSQGSIPIFTGGGLVYSQQMQGA